MADSKPTVAAPVSAQKPEGLTEARKTQLAQHYAGTPDRDKTALVAHFREYGTPDERAFIERISNSRN
jgi:hypothetical protein